MPEIRFWQKAVARLWLEIDEIQRKNTVKYSDKDQNESKCRTLAYILLPKEYIFFFFLNGMFHISLRTQKL